MLTKVMRHFKTLLKYLNDQVYTTKDPTVIEHTSRQIKAINALKTDVKQSMKSTNKRNQNKSMETIFSLSATEGNSEGRSSLASTKPAQRPIMHEI